MIVVFSFSLLLLLKRMGKEFGISLMKFHDAPFILYGRYRAHITRWRLRSPSIGFSRLTRADKMIISQSIYHGQQKRECAQRIARYLNLSYG